jgi:hypothetical protein
MLNPFISSFTTGEINRFRNYTLNLNRSIYKQTILAIYLAGEIENMEYFTIRNLLYRWQEYFFW